MKDLEAVRRYGIFVSSKVGKQPMPDMHDHPFFEIYFVVQGDREYFIGDRFFKVSAGQTVIIPPHTLHRTVGGTVHRMLVHFDSAYLSRYFSRTVIENLTCLEGVAVLRPARENEKRIADIYQALLACYERNLSEGGQEAQLAGYVFELLFLLSHQEGEGAKEEPSASRMEEVLRYIHENYASIRSIGEIADVFYFSKYHLCHLFSRHLGLSVVTYINMIRVRAACRLLDEGARNITELALAVGFNSSAYFCKVFKEQMHQTPLEYRKKGRESASK